MTEKYVRSPEDQALMDRVAKEVALEEAEDTRRFEAREKLYQEKAKLEARIEEINNKIAELD